MQDKIEEIYVESELFNAGYTEDGREFHAERYFVVVQYESGRRIRHNRVFNGTVAEYDYEDGFNRYPDLRETARQGAEALRDKIIDAVMNKKQELNLTCWVEWFPVYGSDAYSNEEAKEWEKRVDEDDFWKKH